MVRANRCDNCNEFSEGQPAISVELSVATNGRTNILESMFGISDDFTVDFCSLTCMESYSFDRARDQLIADLDDKPSLMDDPRLVDLTDIPGITEGMATTMHEFGFHDLRSIADADVHELAELPDVDTSDATKLKEYANERS